MANCSSLLCNFCKLDRTSIYLFLNGITNLTIFMYETKTMAIKISEHSLAQNGYFKLAQITRFY